MLKLTRSPLKAEIHGIKGARKSKPPAGNFCYPAWWLFVVRNGSGENPKFVTLTKAPSGEYGATLRFYDPKIDAWRSTWIGPARGWVLPFIARQVNDEIVLEGNFEGLSRKWIFSEITLESFYWRSIESSDQWASHRMIQEMFARRR